MIRCGVLCLCHGGCAAESLLRTPAGVPDAAAAGVAAGRQRTSRGAAHAGGPAFARRGDAYLLNHAARAATPRERVEEARALSTALELLLHRAAPSNKKKKQAGAAAAAGKRQQDKVTVALLIRPVFPLHSAMHRDNIRAFMEARGARVSRARSPVRGGRQWWRWGGLPLAP